MKTENTNDSWPMTSASAVRNTYFTRENIVSCCDDGMIVPPDLIMVSKSFIYEVEEG